MQDNSKEIITNQEREQFAQKASLQEDKQDYPEENDTKLVDKEAENCFQVDEKLEVLEAEKQRLDDQYKRLAAEFDNYKKRTQKEMAELIQTANKRVVLLMLEVLDDIERAEKQELQDVEAFRQGVTLIFDKLRNNLQQLGVEKLAALDESFNTDLHEAITELSVEENRRGKVVDVVQNGYTLGGKLIRFAKVVIGK